MTENIGKELRTALEELLAVSKVEEDGILVIGCSTSEVLGERIGTAGSEEAAGQLFRAAAEFCRERHLLLAAQCCEHLNRSLVVEKRTMRLYRLVRVMPFPPAGRRGVRVRRLGRDGRTGARREHRGRSRDRHRQHPDRHAPEAGRRPGTGQRPQDRRSPARTRADPLQIRRRGAGPVRSGSRLTAPPEKTAAFI